MKNVMKKTCFVFDFTYDALGARRANSTKNRKMGFSSEKCFHNFIITHTKYHNPIHPPCTEISNFTLETVRQTDYQAALFIIVL